VEKDLGTLADEKVDLSQQSGLAAQKAMYPGLHKQKGGQQVEEGDSPLLCSTLMRVLLQYCVQLCGPQHRKDMELLQQVQRGPQK